jgi:hypothetical protein
LGCELRANSAGGGGGAIDSQLINCLIILNTADSGGGVRWSEVTSCLILGNTANHGGGASGGGLVNSLVVSNSATDGGGVYGESSWLRHCTIVGNVASEWGGGVSGSLEAENSIIYYNTAAANPVSANYFGWAFLSLGGCCSYPAWGSIITNEPALLNAGAGEFRLRYGSPCIDAAVPPRFGILATNDFAGMLRPVDGDFDAVANQDIGAYEYNPATHDSDGDGIPDAWEHGYGLNPTNALDAAENPDGDAHNNFQEYVADTNPTNDLSCLRIVALSNLPPWAVFYEPSSTNRFYTLLWNTNLAVTNWLLLEGRVRVPGAGGVRSLTDTNLDWMRHYRVKVEL